MDPTPFAPFLLSHSDEYKKSFSRWNLNSNWQNCISCLFVLSYDSWNRYNSISLDSRVLIRVLIRRWRNVAGLRQVSFFHLFTAAKIKFADVLRFSPPEHFFSSSFFSINAIHSISIRVPNGSSEMVPRVVCVRALYVYALRGMTRERATKLIDVNRKRSIFFLVREWWKRSRDKLGREFWARESSIVRKEKNIRYECLLVTRDKSSAAKI